MGTSKWAFAALLAATFSVANAADRQSIALSHYEPLHRVEMRSMALADANGFAREESAPMALGFEALGKSFELDLEPNSHLLEAARQNPLLAGVDIYRGELVGIPGSWARIVVVDGVPRGMFWDGNDLYSIEAPGDSIVDSPVPVIYRMSELQVAPGSMSCGSAMLFSSGAEAYQGLVNELGTMAEAQGAIEEIGMGAIGDLEFTTDKGGDAAAAAAIVDRLSRVDGIFSSQLGIQITLDPNAIETFSASAGPFTATTDAATLLREASDYRAITPAQYNNGLTHLWTGKDLDGTTVGIAWTGALCSQNFGAGLSEGNGTPGFDALVAAHEIGHNFGAPHDGEAGDACEAQAGDWLMSPRLNGVDQFSPCSITEMSDDIARASCITALPSIDMQPSLSTGTSVLFGASNVLSYDIDNNGTIDATGVSVDFAIPANLTLDSVAVSQGTCTSDATSASCDIGDVPGLATRTVDLTVTPTALGPGTITATASADADDRPANDQQALQLSVDPAVDLVVNTPTGADIRIDRSTTISAMLENRATLDATGVTLTVSLGNALRATSASWPLGTCTVLSQSVTCQAATFVAQSNSTISVTADGVSAGNPNITVTLASAEADLVPGDNSRNGRLEVKEAKDDSGSGSTGPLFLLLLTMAGLLRRRR